MAVKRFTATKDTTITNARDSFKLKNGVSSSMGAADSLQTFVISGSGAPRDNELSRILLEFPMQDISDLITRGTIPSGTITNGPQYFLRLYNVVHDQQTPKQFHLSVKPVTTYWEEGNGLDMFNYSDKDSANWANATDTKRAGTYQLDCVADTAGDTGGKYFLLNDANNISYKIWIDVDNLSAEPKVALSSENDSSTGVSINQSPAIEEVMPYTKNTSFQSPYRDTAKVTINGPTSELMAFMNWDRLMKLEKRSLATTSCSNGFEET